jgi:magnesium-transporting ATPase (P-type)
MHAKQLPRYDAAIVAHLCTFDRVVDRLVRCTWLRRALVETDLRMLGLLIMQNRLKPQTTPAMAQLIQANIECIMITGDNALTACYVAQQCQMISKYKTIYLTEVHDGHVRWRNLDDSEQAPIAWDDLGRVCGLLHRKWITHLIDRF